MAGSRSQVYLIQRLRVVEGAVGEERRPQSLWKANLKVVIEQSKRLRMRMVVRQVAVPSTSLPFSLWWSAPPPPKGGVRRGEGNR
jgi:hypothetical protein